VLPVVVLAMGAVATAVAARRLATEVSALRPGLDELRRLGEDARAAHLEARSAQRRGAEVVDVASRARAARRAAVEARRGGAER
jgi:hypothetical protein